VAVKTTCLSSKWQPGQWLTSGWERRCSAFRSRCMNCDPFPSPTIVKCSKIAFSLGVKCSPVCEVLRPVTGTRSSNGGIGKVDSTRVSQLKLRGKATEPARNPLKQIMTEACNHAKGGSLFQSDCQGIQAAVVDHIMGAFSRCARHQQTCNDASK
jgi:hypothetical protein